ncbi:pectin acetylesterase-family hydrolase [Pendulispora albinea]|uniref:Pectinacetylesterase family protein n=1 Tax=Pendulispora albinea TaxID=2741071 RepID=A0ABZ2MBS5_9BACT
MDSGIQPFDSDGQGGGNRADGGGGRDGGGSPGPTCEPFTPGEAVQAPANSWTWIGVPEAKCRNGSSSGFGVRLKPGSKKLFIYLQGGGACFNGTTCLGNPSAFGASNFTGWKGTQGNAGIMNDGNANNPVKDWNAVFVPYCSGDIFNGSAPSSNVPGGGPRDQAFLGVSNTLAYLKRIVPTFPEVDQVLLTGSSAGGFGAASNYDRVAQAFCPRPVVMVDDAGPVMSDTYLAPCLQKRFRSVWNLTAGLPAGCAACTDPVTGGGLVNAVPFLTAKYPRGRFGLISGDQDSVIRLFMAFGNDDCRNVDGAPSDYDGAKFARGLADLRDKYLKPAPNAGTYYVGTTSHTFLASSAFYSTTVKGVPLTKWMGDLIKGEPPTHVAP